MSAQAERTSAVEPPPSRAGGRRWWLAGIIVVTAAAAVLRLIALGTVPEDLYYDAAVRSMTLSLHNFFFGAFDPSALTSIDKPPIDLWLQVISVKLFGWGPVALKLPEAIAGTLAIPLQYDLVRRVAGPLPALAGAAVLAFLPTSVITARSDTMDSVMMLLLLVVAWLLLRGAERRQLRWLIAAAVVLGVDFNVKLFEALVPVPAFLFFVWICWRGDAIALRLRRLAAAGAVFAAVALSWIVLVTIVPTRAPAVRDRLDQRQHLECGVRLQRPRPHHAGAEAAQLLDDLGGGADRPRGGGELDLGRRPTHLLDDAGLAAGAVPPVPVQPRRLRHAARDAAVRGDGVRARRARAAAAAAAAAAARRLARAADRLGGGDRASRSGC